MISTGMLILSLLGGSRVAVDTGYPTVILVRHAEKASATESDPSLSEIGRARAAVLDSTLKDVKLTAIIVTQYRRTAETAALVAQRHHLTPIVVPIDPAKLDAHLAAVVQSARQHDGVVLVVGHSNTVSRLAHAFGGPVMPDLCDTNYAAMFTVKWAGQSPTMSITHYGAVVEVAGSAACTGIITVSHLS